MKLRIYAEHIQEYQSFLDTLPEKIKQEIKKASVCKRLIDPNDCNPIVSWDIPLYWMGSSIRNAVTWRFSLL